MRLFLFWLTLALVILVVLYIGLSLRRAIQSGEPFRIPDLLYDAVTSRPARILFGMVMACFALLAIWHVEETREPPKRNYEPARIENGRIVPGQFH
jgi:hypothetical protein